jgi:hypothetical protein
LWNLFNSWKNVQCSKDPEKKVLFNKEARKEADTLIHLATQGFLSDPPGLQLYYKIRTDPDGLTVYCCICGTNTIEGGIHMPLWQTFGSLHAFPELADALLALIHHRRNTTVC